MLTIIHPPIGWPVASLHALLAFSRIPSRSAPVMALLSGRNEAGPLLVKAERTQPNPLLTSEQSLMSGYLVLLVEHLSEGAEGPCLYKPKYRADRWCCILNKLNCYFHMAFCVSVSLCPLVGLVRRVSLLSLSRATPWLWYQTNFKSTYILSIPHPL